jgi:hypothetical protein
LNSLLSVERKEAAIRAVFLILELIMSPLPFGEKEGIQGRNINYFPILF